MADIGIKMNGSLQVLEDATVFPPCFFMPRDTILYKDFEKQIIHIVSIMIVLDGALEPATKT